MFVREHLDCEEFIAGDSSVLREYLHPDKEELRIRYSLAHARVRPGQTTQPHRLKGASEVYVIVEGEGIMHIDGEEREVKKGDTVYIAPDAVQFIHNKGSSDLVFLCLVDPAWTPEMEEIL